MAILIDFPRTPEYYHKNAVELTSMAIFMRLPKLALNSLHTTTVVPIIAIVGAIALGVASPDKLGTSALTVLSTSVGGYFGAITPKDKDGDGKPD